MRDRNDPACFQKYRGSLERSIFPAAFQTILAFSLYQRVAH